MFQISKINNVKVSDAVFDQLKQNILRQELAPGEKLPSESALAEMFGVSRATVRTALQRLATIGLAETRNGDGTYVRHQLESSYFDSFFEMMDLKSRQVLEILEFRLGVEMQSCRLAACRASQQQIEQLAQIVENMKRFSNDNDPRQYSTEDMKFHCCVAEMSHNAIIIMAMQFFSEYYLGHFIEMNIQIKTQFNLAHHVRIYEAIRDGDGAAAEKFIKESINRSIGEVSKWEYL